MRRSNLINLTFIALAATACNWPMSTPSPPQAPAPVASPVTQVTPAPGAPVTAPAAPAAFQTQATVDGKPVTVQVIDLRRVSGNMVMLRMAMTNNGSDIINRVHAYSTVIDTYLVDPAGGMRYEVVRDSQYSALATEMSAINLTPGTRQEVFAQYSAPPPTVTAMTVYVRGGAPLANVPLTP